MDTDLLLKARSTSPPPPACPKWLTEKVLTGRGWGRRGGGSARARQSDSWEPCFCPRRLQNGRSRSVCILRTWDGILSLLPAKLFSFVILWFSALFHGLPSDSSSPLFARGSDEIHFLSSSEDSDSISALVLKAHTFSPVVLELCVPTCPSPLAALTTHPSPRQGKLQVSSTLSIEGVWPHCLCMYLSASEAFLREEASRSRSPASV